MMKILDEKKPQLFLLHYAGGSIYSFNFLLSYLEPNFDAICLELPGRGRRMNEKLITNREEAIQDQFEQILKYKKKDTPFVIFGHSMGALLAYELAKLFEKLDQTPELIIATGNAGPGIYRKQTRYNKDRDGFILALKELGGIPDEVFENEELFSFFEPILRADFEIAEKKETSAPKQIKCPIYCAMGADEKFVHLIDNWANYTHSKVYSRIFEGNHFFISEHPKELSNFIKQAVLESLAL